MRNQRTGGAFTLVETVIALGIFAFAISIMFAMLPIGMRSTRDVANEANAVAIASSIMGIWNHATPGGASVTLPNICNDLPLTTGEQTLYFDEFGRPTGDLERAAISVQYIVAEDRPGLYRVDLLCSWPAQAAQDAEVRQTRVFTEYFAR